MKLSAAPKTEIALKAHHIASYFVNWCKAEFKGTGFWCICSVLRLDWDGKMGAICEMELGPAILMDHYFLYYFVP